MKPRNKKNDVNKEETIEMPEVKDIPGQENIRPPRIGEMNDVTISSDGEEGKGIVDDLNKEDEDFDLSDPSTNVSDLEREVLENADRPVTAETEDLNKLKLDNTDDEDPLNEESDPLDMGEDLDIPGADLDDDDEEIGEEDEENNAYSQGQKDS